MVNDTMRESSVTFVGTEPIDPAKCCHLRLVRNTVCVWNGLPSLPVHYLPV